MILCHAEFYTDIEPITTIQYRAFTKKGAIKKAMKKIKYVDSLKSGTCRYLQVWFGNKKVYGNGNLYL